MTDPIGTAQESPYLIPMLRNEAQGIRDGHPCADQGLLDQAADALQSRIAEVGRLTEALQDIAGAIHLGSASDVMTWHNLANACQQKARAALSLHRRPTDIGRS